MTSYIEKNMNIPVGDSYDVLVAGAGTAGAFAAIAAARQGSKTIVIEKYSAPGGTQTMALVTPTMHSHIESNPQSSYIAKEVIQRLREIGGAVDNDNPSDKGWFDPIALQNVLEKMLIESGCTILYNTTLIDVQKNCSKITHAIVNNTSGTYAIDAKAFVDCTGNGDLAVLSGCDFRSGNENGSNQAISLRFQMTGVDIDQFRKYLINLGEDHSQDNNTFHTASTIDNDSWVLNKVFKDAYEKGLLTKQDITYFQCFSIPGKPHDLAFNCPELLASTDTLNAEHLTNMQIEGVKSINRIASFLKANIAGFEDASISAIAPMLGIRDTRRIVCEYTLTANDILNYRKFDGFIATSNYPIDIHSLGDGKLTLSSNEIAQKYYHIPFKSLVAKCVENLLVAGRCIGADFVAQSAIRVQHTCRAMGEAAGIGAALLIGTDGNAKNLDGCTVRKIMIENGAEFS